jgi:hypothetical protein
MPTILTVDKLGVAIRDVGRYLVAEKFRTRTSHVGCSTLPTDAQRRASGDNRQHALHLLFESGAGSRIRTDDLLITN